MPQRYGSMAPQGIAGEDEKTKPKRPRRMAGRREGTHPMYQCMLCSCEATRMDLHLVRTHKHIKNSRVYQRAMEQKMRVAAPRVTSAQQQNQTHLDILLDTFTQHLQGYSGTKKTFARTQTMVPEYGECSTGWPIGTRPHFSEQP